MKRYGQKTFQSLFLLACATTAGWGQTANLTCIGGASTPLVRSEGITERLGEITLNCLSSAGGGTFAGNLSVFVSGNVTNEIIGLDAAEARVLYEEGGTSVAGRVSAPNTISFPVSFVVPPVASVTLRIQNIRANVSGQGVTSANLITAAVAFTGPSTLQNNLTHFTVGKPERGVLISMTTARLRGVSPVPETIDFNSLLDAGTRYFTTRVTEGFASAFRRRVTDQGQAPTSGVRVMIRYSGLPAGARLFVPNAVAGSTAAQPTSAGDLGLGPAGGSYISATPSGSLLLVRVMGTDANGGGGTLAFVPAPGNPNPVTLIAASEVGLTNGSGFVVYEVVDDDPQVIETAQIPTFLGLNNMQVDPDLLSTAEVSFAAVSTVFTASPTAHVPRFVAADPPRDCEILGDCDAQYFPRLSVTPTELEFTAPSGSGHQIGTIAVRNIGGGVMTWKASLSYKSGSEWLRLISGPGGFRVDALPQNLAPGKYEAVLAIDAGAVAGTKTVAITLNVTPPVPTVRGVTNAANFAAGPVAAGSLASIFGSKLDGESVGVTFDGVAAQILFRSDGQLNVRVPVEMLGKTTVALVVTVDGKTSTPFAVKLAPLAPAVFGVVNQDGTLNTAMNPARAGSVLQVFATGAKTAASGPITARIHDRAIVHPEYADEAPGIPGVQQINLRIPADLPAMTTELVICADMAPVGGQPVCSQPVPVTLTR
ncbi:MAG: hypothetical protein ACK5AZ_09825 [Bryobacteraceae bacterium]